MEASYCVEEREVTKETKRKNDIIKQLKPTLTPHYFRHNYATLLFEAGVEPLIAMKILGHTDYQTTANIYTHLKSERNPAWIWRTYSAGSRKRKARWRRHRLRGISDPGNRCWI